MSGRRPVVLKKTSGDDDVLWSRRNAQFPEPVVEKWVHGLSRERVSTQRLFFSGGGTLDKCGGHDGTRSSRRRRSLTTLSWFGFFRFFDTQWRWAKRRRGTRAVTNPSTLKCPTTYWRLMRRNPSSVCIYSFFDTFTWITSAPVLFPFKIFPRRPKMCLESKSLCERLYVSFVLFFRVTFVLRAQRQLFHPLCVLTFVITMHKDAVEQCPVIRLCHVLVGEKLFVCPTSQFIHGTATIPLLVFCDYVFRLHIHATPVARRMTSTIPNIANIPVV